MKNRLLISFSGGKTSAYMANRLMQSAAAQVTDIVVAFANTGQEHEKTLEYVHKCDKQYGLNVVWVEAVFDPRPGCGTRHRVVTFETAARKGEPFEEMCKKHGIPNSQFPQCTRETKQYPLKSYLRSIGWGSNTYNTAIGIRYDELDRISPASMAQGVFYPLIDWKVRKEDVLAWELQQPVRLGIPEHLGNCVWCWKKSLRKLATVALENPEMFEFPRHLETNYRNHGPGFGDRRLFRGRKTTDDIFKLASDPAFEPFVDSFPFKDEELDLGAACGESCEVGTDGNEEWPSQPASDFL